MSEPSGYALVGANATMNANGFKITVTGYDEGADQYKVKFSDGSTDTWPREEFTITDGPLGHVTSLDDLGLKGETYSNEHGGKQTRLPHRLDLVPQAAIISVGRVLEPGARKYGENNWRKTTVAENINHALGHIAAHLLGRRDEPHLGHAATRILFALELEIEKQKKLDV